MKTIILFFLVCFSHSAIAITYKCIQSGKIIYSTSPCGDNAQVVPNHITPLDGTLSAIDQEPYPVQAEIVQASPPTLRSADSPDIIARMLAKVRRNIVIPSDVPTNARAEIDITLSPEGFVQRVKLVKSSGQEEYDKAVESAILKSQPLPVPTDPALFYNFRELRFKFSPPG
jgi:TonB family protein